MEDAECTSHSHLPVALRIPGESYTRLDIGVVCRIKLFSGPWADDGHCNRGCCRITQQVGKVRALFVGDTIELIAHAQGKREVASHFPCVLYVPVVLMLAKVLIVRTLTRPGFVEEFGIKIIVDDTVKSLRSLLECRVVGRDSLHNGNTKTAQQAIDCHLAAGKEAVWPLLGYVPEVP